MPETTRSRVRKILQGEKPADRLPLLEWATWWDLTLQRWQGEGLPRDLDGPAIKRHLGLDVDYQLWFPQFTPDAPAAPAQGKRFWVERESDYDRLLPYLYPDPPTYYRALWRQRAQEQAQGEVILWITLSGFFWWPRVLLGIEPHLYSFYDQPALLHRINSDQAAYLLRCVNDFTAICTPDFLTFAEDMSYNHGPMLSQAQFADFLAPYYRLTVPRLEQLGIFPIVDSDGQVEILIPWLESVGVRGILPLERRAGVEVSRLRCQHPDFLLLGAFDKTVMHLGEQALRGEFERLLPIMQSGRFLPSVDHQTPPGVSLAQYRQYLSLFRDYAARACRLDDRQEAC